MDILKRELLRKKPDLARGKSELIAENALLRQQLIILSRQVKRPAYQKTDRLLLVLLASIVRNGEGPRYLIRDTDRTFGLDLARVASTSGIKVLRTPYRTRPRECHL